MNLTRIGPDNTALIRNIISYDQKATASGEASDPQKLQKMLSLPEGISFALTRNTQVVGYICMLPIGNLPSRYFESDPLLERDGRIYLVSLLFKQELDTNNKLFLTLIKNMKHACVARGFFRIGMHVPEEHHKAYMNLFEAQYIRSVKWPDGKVQVYLEINLESSSDVPVSETSPPARSAFVTGLSVVSISDAT